MVEFDHRVKCGADYVALRVVKPATEEFVMDGIVVAESAFSNSRLGHYLVEDIGEIASRETGVKAGDYVMADRLAIFYKSEPVGIMRYDSIIMLTDPAKGEFKPILNTCFVEQDRTEVKDLGGIFVQNRSSILNIGTLVDKNIAPGIVFPFEIGDKVFMSRHADLVQVDSRNLYIYKHNDVLCKILED